MDSFAPLNVGKAENDSLDFQWLSEDTFEKLLELPPLANLLDYEVLNTLPVPPVQSQRASSEFKDLEDLRIESTGFSSLYSDAVSYDKPYEKLSRNDFFSGQNRTESMDAPSDSASSNMGKGRPPAAAVRRKKSCDLELEEIRKYFDVPITRAAKEMRVGLTVLKKRCRELNIMRWPHRKIKSLNALISNVKELGMDEEIVMLAEHKRLMEILPDMELTERTKKLRQACFKANYKRRKSLPSSSHHASPFS